ncbi:MAG: pitrilysin family protein [Actinomycetota bacterium]|nr:pitrilysin family protein [Actinomycetota bacterium]
MSERWEGAHSVSVGVWVGVGSRDEAEADAGASHFLEHLLFKGTEGRSARSIAELVDGTGGEMNAASGKESTAFYARLPSDGQDLAVDLLGDVLCDPALRTADVETERLVILEELHLQEDDPADVVASLLDEALFPDHALGREVLGTRESVESLDRDRIAAFHERWYRSPNLVLAAAGVVDHDRLVERVASAFAGRGGGRAPGRSAPRALPCGDRTLQRPTEAVHMAWGWRSIHRHDQRRWALGLGVHILGGGLSSRLFQAVREDRGLAYNVFAGEHLYSDAGALGIHAATEPGRVDELRAVVEDVVAAVAERGITADELEIARRGFEGARLLGLEDSGSRMTRLGNGQSLYGRVESLDEFVASLREVRLEEVNAVLAEALAPVATQVVVGPGA